MRTRTGVRIYAVLGTPLTPADPHLNLDEAQKNFIIFLDSDLKNGFTLYAYGVVQKPQLC